MTTLYFAYGSNMDEDQMARCCPGAEMTGIGVLRGYRFIINNRGYATLRAEPGCTVPGVLWRLTKEHVAALDRYEGFENGLYDKCFRMVGVSESDAVRALVYIDHGNQSLGLPKKGYLEKIIQAACCLPEEHMALLCNWPEKCTFRTFNVLVNRIEAEGGVSGNVARHKDKLVVHIKKSRQRLFLQALDTISQNPALALEDVLADVLLREAEERAAQYNLECAGRCALECASIGRFTTRIFHLRELERLAEYLTRTRGACELAGQGIIVTADPERSHAPEDKVIVSVNAPVLAALWHTLLHDGPVPSPRIRSFLDVFATAADLNRNREMDQEEFCRLLDEVEALASERQGELSAEIDAMGAG